jgi:arginase family enzyme
MVGARLLGDALAARLGVAPAIVGRVTAPLGVDWRQELAAAQPDLHELAEGIDNILAAPAGTPVSTLSRCAVALATLPSVARHRPDACVAWFDAHGDVNTPQTTTTGYIGGMVLTGAAGLWDSGLGGDLDLSNVVLIGARDLDPAERARIEAGAPKLVKCEPGLPERLREMINRRPVYVHLDCDVLEPGIVPTEYSVPAGLTLEDLRAACEVLATSEVVGFEIAEFEATGENPQAPIPALLDALEPLLAAVKA